MKGTSKLPKNARLPAVPSLSTMLPSGTEGGKEFARVVGLLLFKDARNNELEFSLFDDASGDYEGLDGFSRKARAKEIVGYQYKFFPSPLSNAHRQEIKKSLKHALNRSDKKKLIKWVLVTPDDFKNPTQREGGGDFAWFEALRDEYSDQVELEHIGHSKIISFFLESQQLCLYYYPSLVVHGVERRKTIQELRAQYNENMRRRHGRIEFVGMSVYKEGASRRIPLEDIYIPLSLVQEKAEEEDDDTPRVNPISILSPGSKTIILGDPGAGKSTLASFLALVGINKELQERCGFCEDPRLPVVVTLRRYADELKIRRNLSLLEYVCEVVRADFNMPDINLDFFSYYVESGQAIVLFDGLDELPSRDFKSIIRQRIDSFTQNYPINTVVVTSRVIGYEAEIRFDESYGHFRVAKLRLSEIERFIYDWYSVRIEDQVEKDRNVNDLKKIINLPDSDSIRALARNPLLLTIVALVHRIDAVLPDERVVLYQKCTETLLNTWYKAKRHDEETSKGRIERRNRLRIESIAYWMHRKSIKEKGRAVVTKEELVSFLTKFISDKEPLREHDELAEDQAESFVSFIKNTAGLLVEAGDGVYSFIHLTFQEYLSATYLATFGEKDGARSIWAELKGDIQNPKWREVVRLLVASLRSTSTQEYFVEKLLEDTSVARQRDNIMLLLGLLRDSIEPAEIRSEDILGRAIQILAVTVKLNDTSMIIGSIHAWVLRSKENSKALSDAWKRAFEHGNSEFRLKLMLIRVGLEVEHLELEHHTIPHTTINENDFALLRSLILGGEQEKTAHSIAKRLTAISNVWSTYSPDSNAVSVVIFCISLLLDKNQTFRKLLVRELTLLAMTGHGPYSDSGMNFIALASGVTDIHPAIKKAMSYAMKREDPRKTRRDTKPLSSVISKFILGKTPSNMSNDVIRNKLLKFATGVGLPKKILGSNKFGPEEFGHFIMYFQEVFAENIDDAPGSYWESLRTSEGFMSSVFRALEASSGVKMTGLWVEALKSSFKGPVPGVLDSIFSHGAVLALKERLMLDEASYDDLQFAALLIILDVWTWYWRGYDLPEESPVYILLDLEVCKRTSIIKFVIAIREVAKGVKGGKRNLIEIMSSEDPAVNEMMRAAGWYGDIIDI